MKLEPILWGIFSVGGTIAALVLPIHIFLNNIAPQLGWISSNAVAYDTMTRLLGNPLVKAYLIITMCMMFFYAAYRFSFVPRELLLPVSHPAMTKIGYGLAVILAVSTIIIVTIAP